MIGSFHGAPSAKPSTQKKIKEMQSFIEFPKVLLKFATEGSCIKRLYETIK